MNKKIFIIILFFNFLSFGQKRIKIDTIIVKSVFSYQRDNQIPKVIPLDEKYEVSAVEINNFILGIYRLGSYKLEEGEEFRFFGCKFKSEISDEYLFLQMSGGYIGAYDVQFDRKFIFSINTGNTLSNIDFPFHSIFTLNGYLDFLNKYWIKDVKKSLYFPEDDEHCGDTEPYCTYYDIDTYVVEKDRLSFELTHDCFPRVSRACTPFLKKSIPLDTIKPYLNAIGKQLLFEKNYTQKTGIEKFLINKNLQPNIDINIFFFGKINKQYPFSMAINIKANNSVTGYYYYDNKLNKINLSGKKYGNKIFLTEYHKGETTGIFEFTFTEKYNNKSFTIHSGSPYDGNDVSAKYLNGIWSNPNKTKVFEIEFYDVKSNINN